MKCFVKLTDAISGNPVIIQKKEILSVLQVGGSDVHLCASKVFTKQGQGFKVSEKIELIYELLEPDNAKKQSTELAEGLDSDILGKPISSLGLSHRITWALKENCEPPPTVSDLLKFSAEEIIGFPHIGSVAVKTVVLQLEKLGLRLRG